MEDGFEVRTMGRDDLARAIGWAEQEGWNPGRGDLEPFLAADGEGFLIGFLGDVPITSISVVRYGGDYGFLGFYICRPEHRGKGYGWRTWQAGLARLAGRTVGLDGVVAQQSNYARSGFALAYRTVRFGGRPHLAAAADPGIVPVAAHRAAIEAMDSACCPAPRPGFLRAWLNGEGGRYSLALVEDGALRGFGTIRPAVEGWKIGPLFAEDEAGADRLFPALAAHAGGETVFLDAPLPNEAALALARRYRLEPGFETARMYRGPAPDLPLARIFGSTSLELG